MAASVSYRINGKYDGKAVTQAIDGIANLGANAAKTALSIVGITASFAGMVAGLKASAETFKENNTVQTQMFVSLKNNTKMATADVKKLVKEFDGMAGYFDGSEIVKAGGVMAQLGLSEDAMNKTIQVARDMAASGIMPLDQASKALGMTFDGNVSALKKMYPELANLTKAQLKSGEAVEILGQKYAGMEETMSNTFEGMDRKYANAFGGLKDSIGAIVSALQFEGKAGLIDSLNAITDWFNNNRDRIITFFLNLPEVGDLAFKGIKDALKIYFSADGLKSYFSMMLDYAKLVLKAIWDSYIAVCKVIASPMVAAFEFLKDKITGIWDNILTTVKNLFAKAVNSIFDKLPKGIRDWLSGKGFEKMQIESPAPINNKTYSDYFKDFWESSVKPSFAKIGTDFKGNADKLKESAATFAENFQGTYDEFLIGVKNILGKELPEELVAALNYGVIGEGDGNGNNNGSSGNKSNDKWSNVLSNFGEIGTVITKALESSPIGISLAFISSAIKVIGEKTSVLAELGNSISAFFGEVFTPEVISMLNQFLGPVMESVISIGKAFGSVASVVAEIIAPVLLGLSKAISLVAKVIETIGAVVYNIYAAVYNGSHWFSKKKEYKSISDIWSDSGNTDYGKYTTGTSGSSSSMSYNAARDIIVTINYNSSYVNGDAREIALNLRAEIAAAERLGL